MAKQRLFIENKKLEKILSGKNTEKIAFEKDKIIIDGKMVFAKNPYFYNKKPTTNKSTALSLIRKEPEFNYNFCEEMYYVLQQFGVQRIRYAAPKNECTNLDVYVNAANVEGQHYHYMLDLYSAYPHVLKYERLPISGNFYTQEDPSLMNFYLYKAANGRYDLFDNVIITDELKSMVGPLLQGTCYYMFSTDWKRGSKMGDTLHAKAYKNTKTKKELKNVHYGFYQKPYLSLETGNMMVTEKVDINGTIIDKVTYKDESFFVRNPTQIYELLMVAIKSQLTRIVLEFWLGIGDYTAYNFVTDAVYFNELPADITQIDTYMASRGLSGYNYRLCDCFIKSDEDRHGKILHKTFPDLPEPPRSHHKKD